MMDYRNLYGDQPEQKLLGLEVVTNRLIPEFEPVIALSKKVNVSDKFRQQFDQWALDLFGTQRVFYVYQNKHVACHPDTLQWLKVRWQYTDHQSKCKSARAYLMCVGTYLMI